MDTNLNQSMQEQIIDLISQIAEIEKSKIGVDAHLIRDLGLDSMMAIELIAHAEKKFKVKFSEREMGQISSINSLIESISQKLQAK